MFGPIRHLDALRAFSMLFGLFVHPEMLFAMDPFPVVGLVSRHFRMAAFFLVSGFLGSLVAARTSQGAMVGRDTLALMLPFGAMLALAHPFMLWLVRILNEGPFPLGEFLSSEWIPRSSRISDSCRSGPMSFSSCFWRCFSVSRRCSGPPARRRRGGPTR